MPTDFTNDLEQTVTDLIIPGYKQDSNIVKAMRISPVILLSAEKGQGALLAPPEAELPMTEEEVNEYMFQSALMVIANQMTTGEISHIICIGEIKWNDRTFAVAEQSNWRGEHMARVLELATNEDNLPVLREVEGPEHILKDSIVRKASIAFWNKFITSQLELV